MTTKQGTRKKKTPEQALKERRELRTDLGSMRDVMRTPEIEGYVLRWVNDENKNGVNRVQRLRSIGWEVYEGERVEVDEPTNVVESNISLGSGGTLAVGTDPQGKPMTAVLMMIPEELYKADQDLKEEEIRSREEAMLDEGRDDPGVYGGINIGRM